MSGHRSAIKSTNTDNYMVRHFRDGDPNCKEFNITILDNIDCEDDKVRKSKELFWIKLLQTAYPFGLNDQISGYGNISNNIDPLNNPHNPYHGFTIHLKNRNHGLSKNKPTYNNITTIDDFVNTLSNLNANKICRILNTTSKTQLDNLLDYIYSSQEFIELCSNFKKTLFAALSKYYWSNNNRNKKAQDKCHRLKISFTNKCLERLKLNRILNCVEVQSLIHNSIGKKPLHSTISYQYDDPLSKTVFNYNKFLRNLDSTTKRQITTSSCICEKDEYHQFTDSRVGHIYQGSLDVIKNIKLKNVLQKGTKFRISKIDDKTAILSSLCDSFKSHCDFLGRTYNLNQNIIASLKNIYSNKLASLNIYPAHNPNYNFMNILQDIKQIQSHFIIVPIDKASNNYSFICKKLYIGFMDKEMAIHNPNDNSSTFALTRDTNKQEILDKHLADTEFWKIRNPRLHIISNPTIPLIYGIPKMHKADAKLRFITGASSSSIKSISIELQNILTHFKNHFKRYCQAIESRSGIRLYWSINSSQELIDSLKNTNTTNYSNIYTADFESLFTNLPHDAVINAINYIIETCFKNAGTGYQFICKQGNKFRYVKLPPTGQVNYHITEISNMIKYVLSNSYAEYNKTIYKQVNGIPQGNNASPLLADLTLLSMEYKYIITHQNTYNKYNFFAARYMDDILIMGPNLSRILNNFTDMYHPALTLKQTNQNNNKCDFLDISFQFENRHITSKMYNKTDHFNFSVLRFPHSSSNIHINVALNTIIGEIIRIDRCCSFKIDFVMRVKDLYKQFQKNGFEDQMIRRQIQKTILSKKHLQIKYNLSNLTLINHFLHNLTN